MCERLEARTSYRRCLLGIDPVWIKASLAVRPRRRRVSPPATRGWACPGLGDPPRAVMACAAKRLFGNEEFCHGVYSASRATAMSRLAPEGS